MKTLVLIQMLLVLLACAADELTPDAAPSGADNQAVSAATSHGSSR